MSPPAHHHTEPESHAAVPFFISLAGLCPPLIDIPHPASRAIHILVLTVSTAAGGVPPACLTVRSRRWSVHDKRRRDDSRQPEGSRPRARGGAEAQRQGGFPGRPHPGAAPREGQEGAGGEGGKEGAAGSGWWHWNLHRQQEQGRRRQQQEVATTAAPMYN